MMQVQQLIDLGSNYLKCIRRRFAVLWPSAVILLVGCEFSSPAQSSRHFSTSEELGFDDLEAIVFTANQSIVLKDLPVLVTNEQQGLIRGGGVQFRPITPIKGKVLNFESPNKVTFGRNGESVIVTIVDFTVEDPKRYDLIKRVVEGQDFFLWGRIALNSNFWAA